MMFSLLLLVSVFLSSAKSTVLVEGTIVAYDETTVLLKQQSGAQLTVPRSLLPKQKGIRVGAEKVKIELSPADFARLNAKVLQKAEAKMAKKP